MTQAPATMIGLELPNVAVWSERVTVALGQNPSLFTGPGTNTYLIGNGTRRILLDTGDGRESYIPILEQALKERECELQEIVLTHGHADHIGGVKSIQKHFGKLRISKLPWPDFDDGNADDVARIGHGSRINTDGATLRAIHTPGHAPDHLCFLLEEERTLFSGDNVLGVGTTVIPAETGNLSDYLDSLELMLGIEPTHIYPAHGPMIVDGSSKIREYIEHRLKRERQILQILNTRSAKPSEIVEIVYALYPTELHAAAAQSVTQHLLKLELEGRVAREAAPPPLHALWWQI